MTPDYACEKKLYAEAPELHRIFRDAVFCLQNILVSYQAIFPSYTDHTSLHSMQVIDFCNRILGETVREISTADSFVLLMAAYLHDTGMGIRKDDVDEYYDKVGLPRSAEGEKIREDIRQFHNEFSRVFIEKNKNFFDFPSDEIAEAVAQVARGHRKVDLMNGTEYPSAVPTEKYGEIHVPFLAAMIRLADEIDIAADRIPEILVNETVIAQSKASQLEYAKHRAIRHLEIYPDKLVMQVQTKDPDLMREIEELHDKVQETLTYCRNVISQRSPFALTQETLVIEWL